MRKLNHSGDILKVLLDLTKLEIGIIPLGENLDAPRDIKSMSVMNYVDGHL
jgi:hypothetical protein